MTHVRQPAAGGGPLVVRKAAGPKEKQKGVARGAKKVNPRAGGASQVAQVRLQADEMAALREVMRQLRLASTSEALREGIRLLIRDAAELAAAESIRQFYGGSGAPLPDGVVEATAEELAAADEARW
jgi:hypothetical protein